MISPSSNRLAFAVVGFDSDVTISVFTPFGVRVVIVTFTTVLVDGVGRAIDDECVVVVVDGLVVVLEIVETVVDELDVVVDAALLLISVFTSMTSALVSGSVAGLASSSLMISSVFTSSLGAFSVLVGKGEALLVSAE